jgi:hypothetical protein
MCSVEGTTEWGVEDEEGAARETRLEQARPRKVADRACQPHRTSVSTPATTFTLASMYHVLVSAPPYKILLSYTV